MPYNVDLDPHLQQDLAAQMPEVCQQARETLTSWQDEMQSSMPASYTVDPLQTVLAEGEPFYARGNLQRYLPRLRATGRADQAGQLEQRHPGEL